MSSSEVEASKPAPDIFARTLGVVGDSVWDVASAAGCGLRCVGLTRGGTGAAGKALSPAVNDPPTAVQVIDRRCDVLADLRVRTLPSGRLVSRSGRLRVVVPRASWEDLATLACSELRLFGVGSFQVARADEQGLGG